MTTLDTIEASWYQFTTDIPQPSSQNTNTALYIRKNARVPYLSSTIQIPTTKHHDYALVGLWVQLHGAEHKTFTMEFVDNEETLLPFLTLEAKPWASWVHLHYPLPKDCISNWNLGFRLRGESVGMLQITYVYMRLTDIPTTHSPSTGWAFLSAEKSLVWYVDSTSSKSVDDFEEGELFPLPTVVNIPPIDQL